MKRAGDLWDRLVSFENLYAASRAARLGKRSKPDVLEFEFGLENELLRLRNELLSRTWTPGGYREFYIYEPKKRKISAAPYRDRVVHHALVRVIEPIFERGFIHHSYACRTGRGAHRAVDAFQRFLRNQRWCLKMDVERFFPSMDHETLLGLVERKLKCLDTLWLVRRIVECSNPQEPVSRVYPGDDLFTPAERRWGIPIGNLTSQFLANVMLDPLDHFVTETLRIGAYVRYCDDFAVFSDSKRELLDARRRITEFLMGLRLWPHPAKCHVFPASQGSPFLGYRVLTTHRRLLADNIKAFRVRMRRKMRDFSGGVLSVGKARASVQAWIAHAAHADTVGLRQKLLSEVAFSR